jgi:hypothetical protein
MAIGCHPVKPHHHCEMSNLEIGSTWSDLNGVDLRMPSHEGLGKLRLLANEKWGVVCGASPPAWSCDMVLRTSLVRSSFGAAVNG